MLGDRRFLLVCAVLAAGMLLALGFYLPFMRLSTLVLIDQGRPEHSLITAVHALVRTHQVFLGGVILVLAIFLPLLKWLYLLLLTLLQWTDLARAATGPAWLLRWWPQDVLAIAAAGVLIASRETLVERTGGGAYCFAGAVLIMALAALWLRFDPLPRTVALRGSRAQGWPQGPHDAPRGPAFAALVLIALAVFGLGVTMPVMRLADTGAGGNGQSIVGLVLALQARGERALWVPIAVLALLLPGLRLLHLLTVAIARALPRAVRIRVVSTAGVLGRFATADVIALSLMLFYLIETREIDRALQPGVYYLAASAVLALAAYAWANLPAPVPKQGQSSRLTARLEAVQEGGRS